MVKQIMMKPLVAGGNDGILKLLRMVASRLLVMLT